MRRPLRSLALLPLLSLALLAACGKGGAARTALPQDGNAPQAEGPAEPEHASYAESLAEAPLAAVAVARPDRPFPRTAVVGPASLVLTYGEEDGGLSFAAYGNGSDPAGDGTRFDFDSPREARRGTTSYRILGKSLVVTSEGSEGQRRWDSDRFLVAGPAVFQDRILVATDAPSFVALDRDTLAVAFERPMDALATGPLVLLSEPRLVAAFRADGSIGFHSLDQAAVAARGPADPVSALIDPDGTALAAMERKTASLAGTDAVSFPPVRPYGPRREVEEGEVALFRFDEGGKGGSLRLYLDGVGERPYLLAAFDAGGELIRSNVDYTGVERVLELRSEPSATYFIAASFLGGAGADSDGGPERRKARLVVAPK